MLTLVGTMPVLTSCEEFWVDIFGGEDNPSGGSSNGSSNEKPSPVIVRVSGVSIKGLSGNAATLTTGATLQLSAVVSPSNTTEKTVGWVSSDDHVATVSQTGLVTAVGAGTATVRVVSRANASVSAQATITVIDGSIDVSTTPVDQSTADARDM